MKLTSYLWKITLSVLFFAAFFFGSSHATLAGDCYDADGNWYYCDNGSSGCADPSACNYGSADACDYQSCALCPSGTTGTPPDCGTCSGSLTGTYPNCTCANGATDVPTCSATSCESPQTGTYPDCGTCGGATIGDYPNCTCANGATNPPTCDNGTCPNGATDFDTCAQCDANSEMVNGTCVAKQCPAGSDGTPPNCTCANGATPDSGCASCQAGQEMVNGTCVDQCASGTARDSNGNCVCQNAAGNPPACDDYLCKDQTAKNYNDVLPCQYDETACCSDASATNYDPNCPDSTATPPQYADGATCTYCSPDNTTDPQCQVEYCGDSNATNGDPGGANCQASNPSLHCRQNDFICQYPDRQYCDDPTATNFDNGGAQCEAQKISPYQQCVANQGVCSYAQTYCGNDRALNYDKDGAQCQQNSPGATCTQDDNTCQYAYCTIGFSLNITCPSGFQFTTPTNQSYVYSYQYSPTPPTDYGETCNGFTADELQYLQNYFEQKYCGTGSSVGCQGGFCGDIDWCPSIPGVQTDPTQCVDICPNKPGIQTSESQCDTTCQAGMYYDQATNTCTNCVNSQCQQINGACGTATATGADYTSSITGTKACASGLKSAVTKNGTTFNWTCLGIDGGTDQSCQANLVCANGLTYCENKGICSDKCYVGNDCANGNICVFKGNVSLNKKLDVTPLVDRNGTCVVNLDKTSEVFNSFDVTTHCTLSSQDGVISNFDPANLTTDGAGVTSYSMPNIKKDMSYTLKCHDGDVTATTTYETSVGSCRLNIRTIEAN